MKILYYIDKVTTWLDFSWMITRPKIQDPITSKQPDIFNKFDILLEPDMSTPMINKNIQKVNPPSYNSIIALDKKN